MTASRFHNLSDAMLADAIGQQDAICKAAGAELAALKDELRTRKGDNEAFAAYGERYTVTAGDQLANRLDTDAVRKHLGKKAAQFEVTSISTVVRIKPNAAWLAAA